MEGHKLMFDDLIVTVWSAPNYCYRFVCFARRAELALTPFCADVATSPQYWSWTRTSIRLTRRSKRRSRFVFACGPSYKS